MTKKPEISFEVKVSATISVVIEVVVEVPPRRSRWTCGSWCRGALAARGAPGAPRRVLAQRGCVVEAKLLACMAGIVTRAAPPVERGTC